MTDIERYRGDTVPIELEVTDENGAVDITGYSFTLTADPNKRPVDATTNIFSIQGSITDAGAGLVEFSLSPSQVDRIGGYWYDIRQTDASGNIETLVFGKIIFKHTITK